MSAELEGWEVGAGALYTDELFGFTGYLQYGISFLQGRVQVDFTSDKRWQPYFVLGMPLPIKSVKLEPHMMLPFDDLKDLSFGLRVQYQF